MPRPLEGPTFACLRAGNYSESVTLTTEDSGSSSDAPAGFMSYPGEVAAMVASAPVAFRPLPADDPAWIHLPPGVGSQVLVSFLPEAGINSRSHARVPSRNHLTTLFLPFLPFLHPLVVKFMGRVVAAGRV